MRTDQKLFCLKCLLTIFLVILWLLGSAVFGTLLWLRLDFWTNEYLELDGALDRYLILIYVALVDGAVILLFSILGLVGGLRTIKWALVVYLTVLCVAFGLTVAGSVYGFVYRQELQDTIGRNELIKTIVTERYRGQRQDQITRTVDIMQAELKCCGGEHPTDYELSAWQQAGENRKRKAPWSCCKDGQRYESMQYDCNIYVTEQPLGENRLNPDIYQTGCKTALVAFVERYIIVIAGIAITLGVLQLVCITITSILIHVLNNLYVPQPDDIVYDMARNQEKSPYPSRGDYREYYR